MHCVSKRIDKRNWNRSWSSKCKAFSEQLRCLNNTQSNRMNFPKLHFENDLFHTDQSALAKRKEKCPNEFAGIATGSNHECDG